MKRILVTGANKGIGLATVSAILEGYENTQVFLGCRDEARGEQAKKQLCERHPQWRDRICVLPLDVTVQSSVEAASEQIRSSCADDAAPLYAIVNNAGIGLGSSDINTVLDVNVRGVKRVCDACIPLLASSGRIVNVSSASGPNFVSQCSASRQSFFQDATLQWTDIATLMEEAVRAETDDDEIANLGLGEISAYGFSKACVSLYTLILAKDHPQLCINACTPGYIETDLTRPQATLRGAKPADLGMKPPEQGTVATLFLLFGEPQGSGHYYGSDAKRSPLDHYRAPGSPEYLGN